MNRTTLCLSLTLLVLMPALPAQSTPSTTDLQALAQPSGQTAGNTTSPAPMNAQKTAAAPAPFSRLALSAGVSAMGINMQVATNVNRYLNLRGVGNYFTYSVSNVTINSSNGANGVSVSGNLNFATAGVSLDFYPFPRHGFRLSPGVLFYNQNQISASGSLPGGNSITLNNEKFYSDEASPISVSASLGLNTRKQAFTMTTGWGNMISRRGGHWSFPFEIGAAFTGVPTIGMTLTGDACLNAADAADNGATCGSVSTVVGNNLNAQIAKYESDLNALKVYPILSFGIAYNFRIF